MWSGWSVFSILTVRNSHCTGSLWLISVIDWFQYFSKQIIFGKCQWGCRFGPIIVSITHSIVFIVWLTAFVMFNNRLCRILWKENLPKFWVLIRGFKSNFQFFSQESLSYERYRWLIFVFDNWARFTLSVIFLEEVQHLQESYID